MKVTTIGSDVHHYVFTVACIISKCTSCYKKKHQLRILQVIPSTASASEVFVLIDGRKNITPVQFAEGQGHLGH